MAKSYYYLLRTQLQTSPAPFAIATTNRTLLELRQKDYNTNQARGKIFVEVSPAVLLAELTILKKNSPTARRKTGIHSRRNIFAPRPDSEKSS